MPDADLAGYNFSDVTMTTKLYEGKFGGGVVLYSPESGLGPQLMTPRVAKFGAQADLAVNIAGAQAQASVAIDLLPIHGADRSYLLFPVPSGGVGYTASLKTITSNFNAMHHAEHRAAVGPLTNSRRALID
ncbi:MAG: hypothetical protein GVY30_06720 [Chloroflexi bacterium]|jgi:hypothetical protein|nr:hypothetical protein [Chloroflexota bacterium]